MTTYNWADFGIKNPGRFARQRLTNTAAMTSPLTGSVQTAERAGGRWLLKCAWVVAGGERNELESLLTRLNGIEHRLRLPMFDWANRGAWDGGDTITVDGGSQTGYSINLNSDQVSIANYVRAGDFFRFDNCVRMATTDADTDGVGDFTIECWPPIRTSPANGAAVSRGATSTGVYIMRELAEIELEDVLASGEILSRIEATFEDDVLA